MVFMAASWPSTQGWSIFLLQMSQGGIGEGFAHLAGSHAFHCVVGSIDGTNIRKKPPATNKNNYLNRYPAYKLLFNPI